MKRTLQIVAATCLLLVAASIAFYRSASATKPTTAVVIAQTSAVNQTAAFPNTVLFTPTVDADFRCSLYFETLSTNTASESLDVFYADDSSPQFSGGREFQVNPNAAQGGFAQLTQVLHAKAGIPITFEVDVGAGSPSYNFYITLEEF